MVIMLDTCNWGIPGVESLPAHYHVTRQLIRLDDGRELWMTGTIVPPEDILETEEIICISVNWKKIVRELHS
jgi:hypothetical protein